MRFAYPIRRGVLIQRYKRFLADIRLASGEVVVAHCPNPGAMLTCAEPGRSVIVSDRSTDAWRKLRHTWEAIRMGRSWVSVNTAHANHVVAEAIVAGEIPELSGYRSLQRELTCGRSRIDIRLRDAERPDCYVEVKTATMRVGDGALFPDAVTERGRRHLEELLRVARRGQRAIIFFLVPRVDCRWVGPADEIDPEYGRMLRRSLRGGVEAIAYGAQVSPRGIRIASRLPVRMKVPLVAE